MGWISTTRSGRAGALLVLLSVLLLAGAGLVYMAQPAQAQNVPEQGLVIVKDADPADDTPFDFICTPTLESDFEAASYTTYDYPDNCDFTLRDPSDPVEVLGFGAFSVVEVVPSGWNLVGVDCDFVGTNGQSETILRLEQDNGVFVRVPEGTTMVCVFHNERQGRPGRIFVNKVVSSVDAPAASFDFEASWGEDFSLGDGESHASGWLPAGAHTVTESLPAPEWMLESVVCETVPGAAVDYTPTAGGVTVELVEGQVVTCTFTNRYEEEEEEGPSGSLTVIKRTVPAGGTGFEFDGGALGTFALDDGGTQTFTELAAGSYMVEETPAEGWEFASVECDALDYTADGASVTVNLAEGEAAVCTFTNGELPYTGSSLWLPLLLAGLATLVMGLGAWTWSVVRQAERA